MDISRRSESHDHYKNEITQHSIHSLRAEPSSLNSWTKWSLTISNLGFTSRIHNQIGLVQLQTQSWIQTHNSIRRLHAEPRFHDLWSQWTHVTLKQRFTSSSLFQDQNAFTRITNEYKIYHVWQIPQNCRAVDILKTLPDIAVHAI